MARNFHLKPIEDISVGHALSKGTSAYLLIQNNTTSNGGAIKTDSLDSTTINSTTATSTFRLGVVDNSISLKNVNIKNVCFICNHGWYASLASSSCEVSITVNGSQIYSNNNVPSETKIPISDLVDILNSNFQNNFLPEILMTLTSTATTDGSGTESDSVYAFINSAYLIIEYLPKDTVYLRPSADVSIGHTLYPSESTSAYLLINEEVSDEYSTYIIAGNEQGDGEATSIFKMSANIDIPKKIKFVDGAVIMSVSNSNAYSSTFYCALSLTVDGVTASIPSKDLTTRNYTSFVTTSINLLDFDNIENFFDTINNYINKYSQFPDIQCSYYTRSDFNDSTKVNGVNALTSQLCIELEYITLMDIHAKTNNIWTQATGACKKVDGTWINMTEDECKTYIKSNLVINKCVYRGHVEIPLPDIEMTCINDGATGGIMCSYCHKTLKEHDVIIPSDPNNHSYYVTGVCEHCSAVHPEQITFTITYGTDNSSTVSFKTILGMTWEERVNGKKPILADGYSSSIVIENNKVILEITPLSLSGGTTTTTKYILDNVTPTDIIVADATYPTTLI